MPIQANWLPWALLSAAFAALTAIFAKVGLEGIDSDFQPMQLVTVRARSTDATKITEFQMRARVDTPVEVRYFRNGGILQTVLRQMAKSGMGNGHK